jgi:hypothetical protein
MTKLIVVFCKHKFRPHSAFICYVWFSKQTAVISLHSMNILVFYKRDCLLCGINELLNTYRLNLEAQLRSQVSPREICGRQSGTGSEFSPSIAVFPLPISFHEFSVLIFINILPVPGQSGDAWEPSKKHCTFGNRTAMDTKVL